jgi:hypothetical protein
MVSKKRDRCCQIQAGIRIVIRDMEFCLFSTLSLIWYITPSSVFLSRHFIDRQFLVDTGIYHPGNAKFWAVIVIMFSLCIYVSRMGCWFSSFRVWITYNEESLVTCGSKRYGDARSSARCMLLRLHLPLAAFPTTIHENRSIYIVMRVSAWLY